MSYSGADFVEMFVGLGARRVRSMYEEAEKKKPCVVFIDEIDALGRKRLAGGNAGNQEADQTLVALLEKMDVILSKKGGSSIMKKYVCEPCGYEYDPEVGDPDNGIEPGTAFEDLPEDWVCPICYAGKDMFVEQ